MQDNNIENEYNKFIKSLTERIFKEIQHTYGDTYPLNLNLTEEEKLLGELARLQTILNILEEREEYEQCIILRNKIRLIEKKLEEYED